MALKENYKDDILDTSQNVKRKYQMENNGDGTVSFTDVTEYTQQGDSFGSGAINPIAHAINGLNNYTFHPSGSIDLVAYVADDSYYLNNDNKYVLADSTTGQALITSEPSTYKALASNTDLYGIEGEDTVSGFEPSCTPITVGGQTLSTIDEKLTYLCETKDRVQDVYIILSDGTTSYTMLKDIKHAILVWSIASGMEDSLKINNVKLGNLTTKITRGYGINPTSNGYGAQVAYDIELKQGDVITTSGNRGLCIIDTDVQN